MLPWAIPSVLSPLDLLWVLAILFSCYISNWLFCYVLLFSYCTTKLLCHCAFSIKLVGRIFFRFFGYVLFSLHCLTFSWYLLYLSSFINIFWFISLSCIFKLVCGFVLFFSSHSILTCISFIWSFTRWHNFFNFPSSPVCYAGSVFLLHQREFSLLHKLAHLLRWCWPLRHLMIFFLLLQMLH